MPIYEYKCAECGIRFDKLQRFGDPVPDACPNGHSQVHRLLSQPAIIFKGSGFYVTDNGRNGRGNGRNGRGNGRNGRGKPAKTAKAKDSKSATETSASPTDTKKD